MQQYRKHITTLLLLNFLLPQLLGSLHYLLVPHDGFFEQKEVFFQDPGGKDHSCHYHLHSPPALFSRVVTEDRIFNEYFPRLACFGGLLHYVLQPEYNFQLRGPPAALFLIQNGFQPQNIINKIP